MENKCIKDVGGHKRVVKHGKSPQGKQRYLCKVCGRTFLLSYRHRAYWEGTNARIISLLKEGCGTLSISRLLKIAPNTVQKRIAGVAANISRPMITMRMEYEMDEMRTYIGRKQNVYWIAYALRRDNRSVVDFRVGRRSNRTLKPVIETLHISGAQKIYTDKLPNYAHLIDRNIHRTKNRGTNYIERKNLTVRTHLKRLSRKTLCFSRSLAMLIACLKIYFWG